MDLLGVAVELYALAPSEFIAARNVRAKEIQASGDRSLATQVRQLPKTSASVWALNQFAHREPQALSDFAELGTELRTAQQRADREQLDRLLQERKTILRQAIMAAQIDAARAGVRLSPTAVTEVEQSLRAALADSLAQAALFSGRLVRPIQSDGLEPVDLDQAVAGPALAQSAPLTPRHSPAASVSAKTAKAHSARAKSNAALLARTRRVVEEADAAVNAARQEAASFHAERDKLNADARALQEQFDQLEVRRARLDERTAQADRQTQNAMDRSREAHTAADHASKRR